ncbi:MAG TPA: hypothetical protein VFC28_10530 [Opitutaceae bacterium]|jgi:hypothetical protein|nr:hypothetical protein [Opitutaceae bacterium]
MFEHRRDPLLPRRDYFRRLIRHALIAGGILLAALGLGIAGYHCFEGMGWLDAFANAAMILSGMGPLAPLTTAGGKLFAGIYALFSGVAFLTTVGVLVAPVVHRALHKFHVESRSPDR